MTAVSPAVELARISKTFSRSKVVDAVTFDVADGEFFSLLGPSGCGKTTTLRMIAGLESPDADGGAIRIQGAIAHHIPPYERGVGMVFQSYALFPHLSVKRNVAFGLERHGVAAALIPERVTRALELVHLPPDRFNERMPAELSGGERQRVALARALVLEPRILLLDEPLGALDLKLRKAMQLELKRLNRSLGITFIYVTHDQEEALAMSDRVAVMTEGRIAQIGTPAEVYEKPRSDFVARFIGESNLLVGRPAGAGPAGYVEIERGPERFLVPMARPVPPGSEVRIAVRPEWIRLTTETSRQPGDNALAGRVGDIIYLGGTVQVRIVLGDGQEVSAALPNERQLTNPLPWRTGDAVLVTWHPDHCTVLEPAPS